MANNNNSKPKNEGKKIVDSRPKPKREITGKNGNSETVRLYSNGTGPR